MQTVSPRLEKPKPLFLGNADKKRRADGNKTSKGKTQKQDMEIRRPVHKEEENTDSGLSLRHCRSPTGQAARGGQSQTEEMSVETGRAVQETCRCRVCVEWCVQSTAQMLIEQRAAGALYE